MVAGNDSIGNPYIHPDLGGIAVYRSSGSHRHNFVLQRIDFQENMAMAADLRGGHNGAGLPSAFLDNAAGTQG